jgi:small multidrug resistance pump
MAWLYLLLAIIFELVGTTALKFSDGFSKLYWTLGMAVSYGFAFYLLSIVVKTIPLGIAYAVWAGLGTLGAFFISIYIFKTEASNLAWFGVVLVVTGVVLLNAGSNSH